jgi:2-C-methyl-D-erythritol 4-phosphate cytidylyltransferase
VRWTIVLAAGAGTRFGARKQFVTADGRRLVDLAVESAVAASDRTVLVLPQDQGWTGQVVDRVVTGGHDRAASVRAGLAAIPDRTGTVAIHQAANPLATPALFDALFDAVEAGAAGAFPGLRPADLVRRAHGDTAGAVVGRDELVLVQTPAAFRLEVLRAAHTLDLDALEDTARVSAAGYELRVLPGDPRNVHVATVEDLQVVEALLSAGRR